MLCSSSNEDEQRAVKLTGSSDLGYTMKLALLQEEKF